MTAAPTKPRALRRLSQLHDAKSLGRDKELARRLQKGAAEPSPQSYEPAPTSPLGHAIDATSHWFICPQVEGRLLRPALHAHGVGHGAQGPIFH